MQNFTDLSCMAWIWGNFETLCNNLLPLIIFYVLFWPNNPVCFFIGDKLVVSVSSAMHEDIYSYLYVPSYHTSSTYTHPIEIHLLAQLTRIEQHTRVELTNTKLLLYCMYWGSRIQVASGVMEKDSSTTV